MRTLKKWLCGLIVAGAGIGGLWIMSGSSRADAPKPGKAQADSTRLRADPDLAVSIAAPTDKGMGKRFIKLHRSDPYLNVVVQNLSTHSLTLCQEGNSCGYGSLSLEITEVNGKALTPPVKVQRPPVPWFANAMTSDVLAPQEPLVREAHFQLPDSTKNNASSWGKYQNFPFPTEGSSSELKMRAVFEIDKAFNSSAWTGRIESPLHDYTVEWVG